MEKPQKDPKSGEMLPTGARASRLKEDGVNWIDANYDYAKDREAAIQRAESDQPEEEEEGESQSWEDVDWDQIREQVAKGLLENETSVDGATKEKIIQGAATNWNTFYASHKQNFFKNRNYLWMEFPELTEGGFLPQDPSRKVNLLEAGSGVGNTVWPLLERNPDKYFYAFDCSANAIKLLKSHEQYNEERVKAFVCNLSDEDIPTAEIAPGTIDLVTLIFCLSAIPPEKMVSSLKRLGTVMRPGGLILLRDYGLYDLAQMRFFSKKTSRLDENFYKRGDGTLTYFFSKEQAVKIFAEAGFEMVEVHYDTRVIKNRKRKIRMYRVWLQGKFRKL